MSFVGIDKEMFDQIIEFLNKNNIEYEVQGYCFGTSWDEGKYIVIENGIHLENKELPITKIDIHNGVSFMCSIDKPYMNRYVDGVDFFNISSEEYQKEVKRLLNSVVIK